MMDMKSPRVARRAAHHPKQRHQTSRRPKHRMHHNATMDASCARSLATATNAVSQPPP
jgi:hypothetical protein